MNPISNVLHGDNGTRNAFLSDEAKPDQLRHSYRHAVDERGWATSLRMPQPARKELCRLDCQERRGSALTRAGSHLALLFREKFPQFWTALMGHMVVARPLHRPATELAEHREESLGRLLTNARTAVIWAFNGRSDLRMGQSIHLERYFVEKWTLTGEIAIIIQTGWC